MHDLRGDWLVAIQSAEEFYQMQLPNKKTKQLQEVANHENSILKSETEN